ncbi:MULTISPECIES: DUF6030 family protein [unclassified Rhizobium]|uniref:DUF6030 family protein n=1 Tax=unclassified Rhizobium TaxID=2613769 RepID=UPI001ADB6C68|nr:MULTISPECIES: DUF6030 family protein [unclassified Rhizobium]MBO9099860.1 hypothetical protein [Rhizobium sp. L58/93]MBO9131598.1 hypothetical protein [Rhizobium sp. B209b/85]MBO9169849.1 hypothetical protein [Rhizobium sp. L245/93]MBO9185807.1 hypothetical protein [Rhizobium sp. E27B/91]QXZ82569.1 hypothetical protein J5287_10655 [Rhizobium sp. K1/93]
MTVSPPRRKSRIVFWLAAILILTGIVATALLANDRRNLRFLAYRYHIGWLGYETVMPPKKLPQAKQGPRPVAPPPSPPAVVKPVATRLFTNLNSAPSFFLRRWKIAGEKACNAISRAGFPVGPWHQGAIDNSTFECSYQTPVSETAAEEQPSLFVIVRGTPKGEVSSIRVKAILPETPAGQELQAKFQGLVHAIVQAVGWSDLSDATDRIGRLENVTQSSFGARIAFSHEFADPRRFNLILDIDRPTGDRIVAANFFDTSKWLPLPEITARK